MGVAKNYLIPNDGDPSMKRPSGEHQWMFKMDVAKFHKDWGDEFATIPEALDEIEAFGGMLGSKYPQDEQMANKGRSYAARVVNTYIAEQKKVIEKPIEKKAKVQDISVRPKLGTTKKKKAKDGKKKTKSRWG